MNGFCWLMQKESFNITEDFRVTDVTEVKQPTRTVTDVQNQVAGLSVKAKSYTS